MRRALNSGSIAWPIALFAACVTYLALRVPGAEFLLTNNDQGYQMALGMAVAKGRIPGFDFITQYGPGVAFASYLGFALTQSAVGEMLLSVVGYAATITIAVELVRRSAGHELALTAASAMLLWFPRFYKWYYCFFPLAAILFAQWYWVAEEKQGRTPIILLLWSQLVGIAAMFRFDLGLEGCIFGALAVMITHNKRGDWRQLSYRWGIVFVAACALLPMTFLIAICLARGLPQLSMFVRSIYDGAADSVDFYGIAPFQLSLSGGWSQGNALTLLQLLIPVCYLIGCGVGLSNLRAAHRTSGPILLYTSLVGLGIYPQSLHRADLQHLLQVIYPFIMTVALLAGVLIADFRSRALSFNVLGLSGLTLTLATALRLLPAAGTDLGPISGNPVHRWQQIADLPNSAPGQPVADMAVALRRLTPPDAKVFLVMVPTDMALLFFAQRYQPGLFPVYENGMFSNPFWLEHNRAALEISPPDYLVVLNPEADNGKIAPAPFIPGLVQRWRSEFTHTLFQNRRFELLARS